MSQIRDIALWEGDVPYFDDSIGQPRPSMTFYPAGASVRGAVIVCPGGGYAMRAPHEGEPIAKMLNDAGIHAFVLHYRVAPYRYPAAYADLQRAIRTVRHRAQEWNILPDHIGILGFSAGGHLVAYTATHFDAGDPAAKDPVERESSRPDAVIPCYAVLSADHWKIHQGSFENLLGPGASAEEKQKHDTASAVTADTPTAFLWHTAQDDVVHVANSLAFADALARNQVPFSLHVYPYGKHGIGLGLDNPLAKSWSALLAAWLEELGYAGGSANG